MTFERYQELLKSNSCYQIDNNKSLLILSVNGKLLIEITCLPQIAEIEDLEMDANQRMLLFVYPGNNVHPELKVIKAQSDKVTIMTDSESSDAAVAYELSMDEKNEEVILKFISVR